MSKTENTDLVLQLQSIWKEKERCRSLKSSETFTSNDVRNTYFSQIMNVINDYYLGMIGPYFMQRLDRPFRDGLLRPYFPAFNENELYSNLGFLCENHYIKTWHDLKKAGIVFSMWIVFEDSIDIIFNKIISKDNLNNNKLGQFNKIKKLLEGKISEVDLEIIKSKLQSDYIGINNKYNYVLTSLKIEKSEDKKLKQYREFLQFFNILRNTLHTNSRPIKDYHFKISIGDFKFEKDKHIDFFSLNVLYESLVMFIDIFDFIRSKLNFDGEIYNSATLINGSY